MCDRTEENGDVCYSRDNISLERSNPEGMDSDR